jgi:shikimate dehydrogenase
MPAEPAIAVHRRAAVLGHPIEHSLSPVLHRAAYAWLGLDWVYDRVDVDADELASFLGGLDSTWAGLSLTMPLKSAVIDLLDDVDPLVTATGAANTVVLHGGRRTGYNTDVEGLFDALVEHGAALGGIGSATILGAGATARSALAALARLGARSVVVCARRPEAADELRTTADAVGTAIDVRPWDQADLALAAEVVVCTVPAGVADSLAARVPPHPSLLLDVVYDPWPTALARAWSATGGSVASGLDLLLHQAVGQVRLMTGREVPVAPLRAALIAAADRD